MKTRKKAGKKKGKESDEDGAKKKEAISDEMKEAEKKDEPKKADAPKPSEK